MKLLILSFFTVILFYSLVVDNGDKVKTKGIEENIESVHVNFSDSAKNTDFTVFFVNTFVVLEQKSK